MDIKQTTLEVTMTATNQTQISTFLGSALRGAIKGALTSKYCKSMKRGYCDICKHTDCPNMLLFDLKRKEIASIESNLLLVKAPFFDEVSLADKINFSIVVFGESDNRIAILKDILTEGIPMGEPRVKWVATKIIESTSGMDIPEYNKNTQKIGHCKIIFQTPVVSKHINPSMKTDKFIQVCTIRLTGIVNSLHLNYRVPFNELKVDNEYTQIVNFNLQPIILKRKSSSKNRIDIIQAYTGSFELEGELDTLYPYLDIISNLHIGKECTMGLGKFIVER